LDIGHWTLDTTQVACRAAALAMLVAFWFDGGLFTLATAAVFWILLELGAETQFKPRINTDEHGFSKEKLVERSRPSRTARSLNCLEQLLIRVLLCPSVVKDL